MKNYRDNDGNEITLSGKWAAGILLLVFTSLAVFLIVALWPDQVPTTAKDSSFYYKIDFFQVRKVTIPDSCFGRPVSTTNTKLIGSPKLKPALSKDSPDKDSIKVKIAPIVAVAKTNKATVAQCHCFEGTIHFNTLCLILVALGGFLGNMIYIGASFTTFVGVGKFKRSWSLWYIIKPFIASALALAMYFALCGGILTVNNTPENINIYSVMIVAILTGLFTDRAALKLGDLFDGVVKPKDERPAPLKAVTKITNVTPLLIQRNIENILSVSGEHLNLGNLKFLIDDVEVTAVVNETLATIKYKIPDTLTKERLVFIVKNEKDIEVFKQTLSITKS